MNRSPYTPYASASLQPGLSHRENRGGASSGRASPAEDIPSSYSSHRTAEQLESGNDEAIEGLSAKVSLLKQITQNIGSEVRDSTKLLSGMNDSFDQTQGLLGGTFRRLNDMSKKQGGRWLYWLAFIVIVFWIFVIGTNA